MVKRSVVLLVTAAVWVAVCLLAAPAECEERVLFHFAVLSDRTGGHTHGVYPRVIEEINLLHPDLVITVGDHIEGYGTDYDRARAEWDTVVTFLSTIDVPIHLTPGNHDIWDDQSEALYRERTGRRPYYSFDYENVHFVILDSSRLMGDCDRFRARRCGGRARWRASA